MLLVARGSHAGSIVSIAQLDGPSESPPNASPGTGFAEVDFDIVAHFMRVRVTFSGLEGTTTASHIHSSTATPGAGNAIVATQVPSFVGFPLGVTSGTYDHTFDTSLASTYNPAFVTAHGGTAAGAEAALGASLEAATAYLNIHTTVFPGGEIRGFLHAVPEPGSIILLGIGALGLLACGARRPGHRPATSAPKTKPDVYRPLRPSSELQSR
jgi:hypothetical protein